MSIHACNFIYVQFCLQCGDDFQCQPCELPKSSENDNYAEVNVTENKHRPKPRPPADTKYTVVYSDHIMKGQPPPPPYEPVELKQVSNLQASATVIPAGMKVDDSEFSNEIVEVWLPHIENCKEAACNVILKLVCLKNDLIFI